jgi:hypothetical protein
MGEKKKICRLFVGKPEVKGPLGRIRRSGVDYIKKDIRETGLDGIGWIDVAQNRENCSALVKAVMNFPAP